ncbi:MAG: hypothetical protein ACHRXM_34835 [Isosphaerales bacterium]
MPISVEALEGRALLSGVYGLSGNHGHGLLANSHPVTALSVQHGPLQHQLAISVVHDAKKPKQPTGMVTKRPKFYNLYTGPKLKELNATAASVKLSKDGSTFTFTGTVQAKISSDVAAYVWGIDRNGNLVPGPFQGRPNIKFDAVLNVSLNASLQPTATVISLTTGTMTTLPAGSASIHGKVITVTVPSSLLPSTGLAASQYRFNFWPDNMSEQGVASFIPESSDVQVGRSK